MNDHERIKLLTDVIETNREETELIINKLLTEISRLKNRSDKKPKEFIHVDYSQIPEHMREGMEGYLEYGWEPGGFLYSILINDLRGTVKRADPANRFLLLKWIDFCLEFLPGASWGSPAAVSYWMVFRRKIHNTKPTQTGSQGKENEDARD